MSLVGSAFYAYMISIISPSELLKSPTSVLRFLHRNTFAPFERYSTIFNPLKQYDLKKVFDYYNFKIVINMKQTVKLITFNV
jgi:hypothetical protein